MLVTCSFARSALVNDPLDLFSEPCNIACVSPVIWHTRRPNKEWEQNVMHREDSDAAIRDHAVQIIRHEKRLLTVRSLIIKLDVGVSGAYRNINNNFALQLHRDLCQLHVVEIIALLDLFNHLQSNIFDDLGHS